MSKKKVEKTVYNKIIEKVEEYDIKSVVVASNSGKSTLKINDVLGEKVQIISISEFEYSANIKKQMKKQKIVTIDNINLSIQDNIEMRETLLMFGSGVKAAMEVATIALTKELVQGRFMAIAGEKKKLDTILIIDTPHPRSELISDPSKQMKVKDLIKY